MATVSDIIQQIAFLEGGGKPEGRSSYDKIANIFGQVQNLGQIAQKIGEDRLNRKLTLMKMQEQEEAQKTIGQRYGVPAEVTPQDILRSRGIDKETIAGFSPENYPVTMRTIQPELEKARQARESGLQKLEELGLPREYEGQTLERAKQVEEIKKLGRENRTVWFNQTTGDVQTERPLDTRGYVPVNSSDFLKSITQLGVAKLRAKYSGRSASSINEPFPKEISDELYRQLGIDPKGWPALNARTAGQMSKVRGQNLKATLDSIGYTIKAKKDELTGLSDEDKPGILELISEFKKTAEPIANPNKVELLIDAKGNRAYRFPDGRIEVIR